MGESIYLLKVKKLALEEAKEKLSSNFEELKEVSLTKDCRLKEKDQELEKAKNKISKLEKSNAEAFDEITGLKADVAFIEQQWRESAFEIKANILAYCQVICPEVDFGEVGLDKHIVDEHIEVAPISDDGDDSPGNNLTTPTADPQG